MKAKDLFERLEYKCLQGDLECEVTGFSHDNREVNEGDLFVCIRGARFDTHGCVDSIAEKKASVIVVEQEVPLPDGVTVVLVADTRIAEALLACAYYGYPSEKLTTVGITGSKGKTTTTHMIADILRADGKKVATLGTNGAIIDNKIYELNNTTPDALEVQMYLSMMVKSGCEYAVIEVSSQGLKQHRVSGIDFDYGIFTNISAGDHIGPNEHKDFAEYLYCKGCLIRQSKVGIVNIDDEHTGEMLKGIDTPVITYGTLGNADYIAENIRKIKIPGSQISDIYIKNETDNSLNKQINAAYIENDTEEGINKKSTKKENTDKKNSNLINPAISFDVKGKLEDSFIVNLPGVFNVKNALAAISVCHELNISDNAMKNALNHLNIKGRLDMVYRSDKFSVCVDFAHNGYSTRNLLEALREYRPKRLVCVFGADGNRSKSRRYEMGEASGKLADLSIVTAGHNRWETFEQICKDIQVGLAKTTGSYIIIPKRQEAIRYAIEHAEEGDVITIIGLGHETYQEESG